jgi:hypothetical protein
MPLILDLRAQLADRVVRARALIEYINSNGLLGKVIHVSLNFCRPRLTLPVSYSCPKALVVS